jgi:hypothetical protein
VQKLCTEIIQQQAFWYTISVKGLYTSKLLTKKVQSHLFTSYFFCTHGVLHTMVVVLVRALLLVLVLCVILHT